ncbi:Alpha/Beta hydrolase protein [Syncephalastrum racemosum]|uniref:Alpha/Beta hydrolase protein n=1 Tax=Syncephalastrum racemosum TaxID=13706 RepID=A0A1X2H6M7_SYNRA|nr:Alpha/Beta hydrolase protein [Syncephalastrum racemosum]
MAQSFRSLGYIQRSASSKDNQTTLCFLAGFRSDVTNSLKSDAIADLAKEYGYGFLGWHGKNNDGRFANNVATWADDSVALIQEKVQGRLVLAGASMGLWLALLVAQRCRSIDGILGIGGGIHFTERWLEQEVPPEHRNDPNFVWQRPSAYDPDGHYDIPVRFLLGSRKALFPETIEVHCPVQLIHGAQDRDVPLSHAKALAKRIRASSIKLNVIPDGDHRLSRPEDLACIRSAMLSLVKDRR